MQEKLNYEENIGAALVIIGGAEDKYNERLILRQFLDLAGNRAANILIIPIASDFPEMAASAYSEVFRNLGARTVSILQAASRKEVMNIKAEKILKNISGIFITGGDQMRLTTILGGTPFIQLLKKRISQDLVLAGSSAGAAGLSTSMIARGKPALRPQKDALRISPGLGILQNIIIDQHFSERTRLSRLITAVTYNPRNLGIGIDENTAIVITREGKLKVIGSGTVTILDGSEIGCTNMTEVSPTDPFSVTGLRLHILTNGMIFDLDKREPLEVKTRLPHRDSEKNPPVDNSLENI